MAKDPKELEKERIAKYNNKEIVALTDYEHATLRPTMYIGSVEKSEEKVQIVEPGKLVEKNKIISVGFYKMLNEIVDNAFDEAKRMKGAMPKIIVKVNSKTNQVSVTDTGGGFINAEKTNPKTEKSNVETAMSMLRAGSNFYNEGSTDSLIGTNGVGAALVNMLSEQFSVTTVNSEVEYNVSWNRFIKKDETIKPKNKKTPTGTTVTYIPRKDIFKDCTWDKEYLHTMFIFREFLKKQDTVISNLDIEFYFDDEKMKLDVLFIPEDAVVIQTKIGMIAVWKGYEGSTSASFINGAICTGPHQRIFTEWINELFNYQYAHHFYQSFIILNFPPSLVKFGDQNKTKYAAGRWEIYPVLDKEFKKKIDRTIPRTQFFDDVKKLIDEKTAQQHLNNIKNKKRTSAKKISDKYFPPSQSKGTLFIVEGSCIHEDEEVNVWRNGEPLCLKIKDVSVGDEIITHRNRIRKILNVQKKLKRTKKLTLSDGSVLIQSEAHRYYVYDKLKEQFIFIPVSEMIPGKHTLVRNRLSSFIGCVEVVESYKQPGYYSECFILENGEMFQNSPEHSYCVFNSTTNEFEMKKSKFISVGDSIAIFDK